MPRRHPDARLRIISHLVQVAVHQPAGPAGPAPCGEQHEHSDPDILRAKSVASWKIQTGHLLGRAVQTIAYILIPIGSMYAIVGNIYHQYTTNVSIYTSTMDPMGINWASQSLEV